MNQEDAGKTSRDKEELRRRIWNLMAEEGFSDRPHGRIPRFHGQNRAAERLRRWPIYRQARCLMVPPDEALFQVRLNALRDGKRLLMATPGLRDGFYELAPAGIPSGRWPQAVRTSGVLRHGRRLATRGETLGKVDLLVTGAVAVDRGGGRVGKGHGYFDLEYGILRHLGCVDEETPVVGLVHDSQIISQAPLGAGDVPLDGILTPERFFLCTERGPKPEGIPWERLSPKEIRRTRPLWEIQRAGEGGSGGSGRRW
jgi:5-formyltetrahydrofolate cyclo-ligase